MLQDIGSHRFRNEYHHIQADRSDLCLVYRNGRVLVKYTDGEISYPTFEKLGAHPEKGIYAFAVDDNHLFLYLEKVEENKEYTYEPLNLLREARPREMSYAGVVGNHLNQWYRDNVFCGSCAARLVHDTKERMLYCPDCGNKIYPKICPAVIVCVTHKDKVLLTKYAGRSYQKYALIAGFTEIGETAEETVSREVMEEVGLKIKNITYYKSQPWGFSGGLLMGFFCEADGDTEITIDTNELSVGKWVDMEMLKDMDDGVSLTREMMRRAYERWRDNKKEQGKSL
ncbi:MAG: NAD(+) diphosphatase [Eubacteriales bacterium]|nr:NAD(+) diphosphatase [Eubacteriales bacterium]